MKGYFEKMKPVIRQLNAQEQEYYEKSLYPLQDEVLDLFTEERFYLTGGTCLSRFYFKHRYSEDLVFFFDGTLYSVNQFEIDYLKLVSKIKASNEIEITVAGEHFKRLFIKKKDVALEIEFIYEPYPRIDNVIKLKNIFIDTKENIAVNKLTAVFTSGNPSLWEKTAKDFFDLYFLLRELDLTALLKKTEIKIIPPAYEDLIISLKNTFFEGEVLTSQEINEGEFFNFVKQLINNLLEYARRI